MVALFRWRGWLGVVGSVTLLLIILVAGGVSAAGPGPLLTINQLQSDRFPEMVAYVTVSDGSGIPIAGLTREAFEVLQDGRPIAEITTASAIGSAEGIAVILVLDGSGSMAGRPLRDMQEAARAFIGGLGANDQAALITFGDQVTTLQDYTSDPAALYEAVDALTAEGDTALYEAIYDAVDDAARLPPGRKFVLVLTDGEDTASTVTLDDAIARAREASVPVYAIGLGDFIADPLRRVTKVTGGRYLEAASSAELAERFTLVSDQLRQQYVITFRSNVPGDGQEHTVTIRVTHQGEISQDSRSFVANPVVPTVTLPDLTDGARVAGKVVIEPQITPDDFVTQVTVTLDGTPLTTLDATPYRYEWDTSGVAPGDHTLGVKVLDQAGRETEATVRVEVVPLLRVDLPSLADGAQLTGETVLQPEIEAFHPLASVEYLVDGQPLVTLDTPPFEYRWDLAGTAPGSHTLTLRVTDDQGNRAEVARSVTVLVPMSVRFTLPAGDTDLRGATTLAAEIDPPDYVRQVEYLLDGQPLATVSAPPFEYEWDLQGVENGQHTLVVRATDSAGRQAQTSMVVTVAVATFPWELLLAAAVGLAVLVPFVILLRRGRSDADSASRPAPAAGRGVGKTIIAPREGRAGSAWLGEKEGEGRQWHIAEGETIIGRAGSECDIHIEDQLASRRHAVIRQEDGVFIFTDLSPTNPSFINGELYTDPHRLQDGDEIMIGDTTLVFRVA